MKYLDEYRDPDAAQKLVDAIDRTATRPWTIMEVCGGQTHTIVKYGIDGCCRPASSWSTAPAARCASRRWRRSTAPTPSPRGPTSSSARSATCCACPGSRGDLLQLKSQGSDVRDRLLAARRREPRGRQPGPAGGVLRHRLRDDRPGQRDGRLAGEATRADELQRAGLARPGAAGDDRHPRRARQPRAGFLGPGHVCTVMGYDGVRADRAPPTACRSSSPASSRSTCSKACSAAVRQLEAGRAEVENQYGRAVRPRGQPGSRAADRRGVRGLRPQVARHRR